MSGSLRRAVLAAVAALALLVLTAAFVPVTLTARGGAPESDLWQSSGEAHATSIEVAADAQRPAHVSVDLDWPQRFDAGLITSGQQPAEDATLTVERGEPLELEGVLGDVTITALPDSGPATARRDAAAPVSLSPGSAVVLPSPEQRYTRTTAMLWRSIPAGLQDPSGAHLTATIGTRTIDLAGQDVVPLSASATPALRVAILGWLTLLAAAGMLALFWLLGRSLDPSADAGAGREALRAAAGAALLFVVLNGASYWIPVRWAAPLVAALAVAAIVVRWVRARPPLADSAGAGGSLLLLASIPGVVLFFPVLLWGASYVGEYKTDLFEYSSLASIVRDHSLISMQNLPEAQQAGVLTSGAGFSWRSIDSVSAAGVSVFGPSTVAAFGLLAILLYLIYATSLLGLRAHLGGGKVATAVVVLTLLAPPFTGLLTEDYLSQYYLLAFAPALILALTVLLEKAPEISRSGGFLGLATAAVLAAMGAVYPYFLAVLIFGVLVAALAGRDRIRSALRVGPAIAVLTLVLLNLALLTVVNFKQTEVFQSGLDSIARNVLLAGYSPLQLVMLGAGFQPYQWRAADQPATAAMGFPGRELWAAAADAATPGTLTVALLALLVVVTAVAIRWRASAGSFAFLASLATIAVWLGFSAYLLAGDSVYAAFKAFWTTACLLPLIFATSQWRPRVLPGVLALTAISSLLWMRVDVADRATWLITRDGKEAAPSHASLQPELEEARDAITGATTMAIVRGDQPIAGTDRDRVAFALLTTIARDENVDCVNCTGATLDPQSACASDGGAAEQTPEVIVVVGGSGEPELCGRSLVYDGRTIEVFK